MTLERAMAPDAPILHDDMVDRAASRADARRARPTSRRAWSCSAATSTQGFAEADVVVEREFRTPMVHQGYIEPHACVARVRRRRPRRRLVLRRRARSSVRDAVRRHPAASTPRTIKVMPSEIGGGFGGKIPVYLEPLAIVLSRKAQPAGEDGDEPRRGVPRDRSDLGLRRSAMKLGAKRDGTLVAAERLAVVRSGRLPRLAVRRGAMCALACYNDPELPHRSVRRGRQQAEGRGVPRARVADGDVRDRVADRRARATARHRSDRAAAEERGRRRRSRRRTARRTARSA